MALKLDWDGTNYVLSSRDESQTVRSIPLSESDVLTLAQSAQAIQMDILKRHDPKGGEHLAVSATDVAQISLQTEALGQALLTTLIAPSGSRLTFAIPEHIVSHLIDRLPKYLSEMQSKKMTKQ
jgi:hypothetical protein